MLRAVGQGNMNEFTRTQNTKWENDKKYNDHNRAIFWMKNAFRIPHWSFHELMKGSFWIFLDLMEMLIFKCDLNALKINFKLMILSLISIEMIRYLSPRQINFKLISIYINLYIMSNVMLVASKTCNFRLLLRHLLS